MSIFLINIRYEQQDTRTTINAAPSESECASPKSPVSFSERHVEASASSGGE